MYPCHPRLWPWRTMAYGRRLCMEGSGSWRAAACARPPATWSTGVHLRAGPPLLASEAAAWPGALQGGGGRPCAQVRRAGWQAELWWKCTPSPNGLTSRWSNLVLLPFKGKGPLVRRGDLTAWRHPRTRTYAPTHAPTRCGRKSGGYMAGVRG